MFFWLFFVLLLILLMAVIPTWPYSRTWGVYPGGGVALILIIFLLIWWMGWLTVTSNP